MFTLFLYNYNYPIQKWDIFPYKAQAQLSFLGSIMPVISRFFGIMIIMYWNDHNPPHVHAKYAEYDAIISIDGRVIDGTLPNRALNLVLEWLNIHTTELLDNWYRAANGQEIRPIAPLE